MSHFHLHIPLVDTHPRHQWLVGAIQKRLREKYHTLGVSVNEEKSKVPDLKNNESFTFLGYHFRRVKSRRGKWTAFYAPELTKRTLFLKQLREIFRRFRSQPVNLVIERINPILRAVIPHTVT